MVQSLSYWARLYERLKFSSLCLDIETAGVNSRSVVSNTGEKKSHDGAGDYPRRLFARSKFD